MATDTRERTRRRSLGVAACLSVLALGSACYTSSFGCKDDGDCVSGGIGGICEDIGACSFLDDECRSGRRFGHLSAGDHAGECVDSMDMTEATGTDTSQDAGAESSAPGDDPSTTHCREDWWNCAWSRRIAIELPATEEPLADVPVLVVLGAPRIDPAEAGPKGVDMRFVDADGKPVPHEIERWDPTGTSFVWISVPSLAPGERPRLWLYYRNAAATQETRSHNVWSSVHAAVWHLQPEVIDSTRNGHTGVVNDGVREVPGHLGVAQDFGAVDARMVVPADELLDDVFVSGGTISAWLRPDTYGGGSYGRIAEKLGAAGGWTLYLSGASGGELNFGQVYDRGLADWRSQGAAIAEDAWVHVAVTFNASTDVTPRIYVNGREQSVIPTGGIPSNTPASDAQHDLVIGNAKDVVDRWFDGRIDELRIERTVRSTAWVEIQYRSMTDTLLLFSPPERLEDGS